VLLWDLFGASAALAGGIALAAAPLSVEAARSATPTSLAAALALLFAWLLWRVLRGRGGLALAAVAGGAALHAGYAALAPAFGALLAAARFHEPAAAARTAVAVLIALLLFLPWLAYDLPTEPGGEMVPRLSPWVAAAAAPHDLLFGAPPRGEPPAVERIASLVVLGLALLGLGRAAWRRPAAAIFALAVVVLGVAGPIATAWLGPRRFTPANALAALPLYLGLAGFGLDGVLRLVPSASLRTLAAFAVAAAFAVQVEVPAFRRPNVDWRGAFEIVLANLGPRTRVVAPLAGAAVEFYAPELERRLPGSWSMARSRAWLAPASEGWIVAGSAARFHPEWRSLRLGLGDRFWLDLPVAGEPTLSFFSRRKPRLYERACAFRLPAPVLARGTFLRDCLSEVGAAEGPLRQVRQLAAAEGIGLRNPSLLQAVTLLVRAERLAEAEALVDAIASREPTWLAARQAQVAVRERRQSRGDGRG
jgi:hypothetical protein